MGKESRQEWPMLIVDRLERFHIKLFGDLIDSFDETFLKEGWQLQASLEVIKPMFSTIHWPKSGKLNARAKFIGGVLGHTVAHYNELCDPQVWSHICDMSTKLCEMAKELMIDGKDDEKPEPLMEDENLFLIAKPIFDSAITSAMRHALRQSTPEQIMFFEGYSKALRRGSITKNAKGVAETTRASAYQLIAACGPLVGDRWRSVHDVHRFLEIMLGKQRAGTIKRTEGICKTINLRFRSAGRPPKKSEKIALLGDTPV